MPSPPPPRGKPFEPGNPGKQKGARPISERRARKMLERAVMADVCGPLAGDFDGDALGYLQAVYRGERMGDPLRLSAANAALKFERPSLQAVVTKDISTQPTTQNDIDAAILALVEGSSANVVTIESSPDTSGAGGYELGGQDGAIEAPSAS
jgi:hypothetical protein